MSIDVGHAPFLLLSIRAEDAAADDEYGAMMRFAELDADGLHRIRLTHRPLGDIDLADWSGIILGGGPYNVSDAPDSKSQTQLRVESELLPLIGRIVEHDYPFLGCCYGVGTLGSVIGAAVDRTHPEPVGALTVTDKDELMLITTKGQMVRTRVKEIRVVGRNTMGVKLMDLRGSEKLQAIAPVVSQAEEEAQTAEAPAEKS